MYARGFGMVRVGVGVVLLQFSIALSPMNLPSSQALLLREILLLCLRHRYRTRRVRVTRIPSLRSTPPFASRQPNGNPKSEHTTHWQRRTSTAW